MEIDINLSVLFHAIFYISIEIKSGAAGLADGPPHFSGPASQQGRRLELLRSSMYLRQ